MREWCPKFVPCLYLPSDWGWWHRVGARMPCPKETQLKAKHPRVLQPSSLQSEHRCLPAAGSKLQGDPRSPSLLPPSSFKVGGVCKSTTIIHENH